jgi:hypothetical protein
MARNFIGKVTRHSEKAGVTLRARVTSPSKNVTAYKDFKCMVKASGLSDEQAVITDLNYIANKLLANGVTGIQQNLSTYMPKTGPNGTTVTYTVSGEEITDYFNSDGVVIKRPEYGKPAVIGTLYIYVTKNKTGAGREITISIDPYNITEVKESIVNSITWDKIRGLNGVESTDEDTNGPSNVVFPLQLISEIKSDLIGEPIKVTWNIKSDPLENLLKQPRIDIKDSGEGIIFRPGYHEMYEAKESFYTYQNSMVICQNKVESSVSKTYMRLSGLVLTASYEIIDSVNATTINDNVVFNLKTLSAPATNDEIALYIQSIIGEFKIKDLTYNQSFTTNSMNDGVESARNVYYDLKYLNPQQASVLSFYTKKEIVELTKNNGFTNENNGLKIANLSWAIIAPNSMETTPVSIPGTDYSYEGLMSPTMDASKELKLTLNPVSEPSNKTLILRATFSVSQYDDSPASVTVFYWFNCVDSATLIPEQDNENIPGTGETPTPDNDETL